VNAARLPPTLIALTPGDAAAAGSGELEQRVRAALAGGLRGVLLREPELEDRAFERVACALRELLGAVDGWLGLHDRVHLAHATRADAVHLGFRSLAPATVRASWPELTIGLSTHAGDDPAEWAAADYLFHGPVFATPKAHPVEPVGIPGLRRAIASTELPVWGLGGIGAGQAADVLDAGARGVAVLSGVLRDDDPGRRAAEYLRRR
jgi:thiamine-phosphate pyrophosphorylase